VKLLKNIHIIYVEKLRKLGMVTGRRLMINYLLV